MGVREPDGAPRSDADAVADGGIDATAADDADIHADALGNGHISC